MDLYLIENMDNMDEVDEVDDVDGCGDPSSL